jgi:glutamyl-tRNA(Gln) amidotransferase subunit E
MDYSKLGLTVGIEIHQQLDTKHKLFCKCPTIHRDVEEANFKFFRYLRSKKSEIGEVDRAAKEEVERKRRFIYHSYDTTCLVESDEEPPRELNKEALKLSILIARMLNMKLVDEVHVMRKIVIDGSNTTGFQRTALVAFDGNIEVEVGGEIRKVGIATLCVEEEACRKIEDRGNEVIYSLDRLGIPLVEIGTEPDIDTPEMAKLVAKKLGMILRSTGRVKRGLGTIRQDVNISIKNGARVEIKGVQTLDIIDKIVKYEVLRQLSLLQIRDELKRRNASVDKKIYDVKPIFSNTNSKILKKAEAIMAIKLKGFSGIVGTEIQPGRRVGTEFADIAKTFGLGGIFHTDELLAYGISEKEINLLKTAVEAKETDAVVIAAGDRSRVERALMRIADRAEYCLIGVPEETRKANEDGTSSYLRPLPGAARMYPETDIPPVRITEDMLKECLPELIEDRAKRYMKMGLSEDLAWIIADSRYYRIFEEFAKKLPVSVVARVLHIIPAELKKDGFNVDLLDEEHYRRTLELIVEGKIAKEGAEEVLRFLAANPEISSEDLLKVVGAENSTVEELEMFLDKLVEEKMDLIRDRGAGAFKPLMGIVMKKFRGKVDGKIIAEKLKNKIEDITRYLDN